MKTKSKHVGPGGIKCPCCNPMGHAITKGKTWTRRYDRRISKAISAAEVIAYYSEEKGDIDEATKGI